MFSINGTKIGGEFLVNTQGVGTQQSATVTETLDGGFVVGWASFDTLQDGSGSAIKAQVFGATGAKVGSELLINSLKTGNQFLPNFTTLADGRIVATWVSDNGDGAGFGLRAQFLTANSAPQISSGGGFAVAENQTAVGIVTASDLGGPQAIKVLNPPRKTI